MAVEARKATELGDLAVDADILERPRYSAWRDMLHRLQRNRMSFFSMIAILVMTSTRRTVCNNHPLSPHNQTFQNLNG